LDTANEDTVDIKDQLVALVDVANCAVVLDIEDIAV
jgi:hypothetical protein